MNTFKHGYALLIGVGACHYSRWSLSVTVKDVQALKGVLTDATLCAYPDNEKHVRLLSDAKATRDGILDGLAWLKTCADADPEATIVVYYSGHGWLDGSTDQYYLIPHDVEPFDIPGSALSARTFTNALRQIKARRLLVVVDSCHAEGMASAKDQSTIKLPRGFAKTTPPQTWLDDLKQGAGRAVFTSSRGTQLSWVRPDQSMSIYTSHLIEALQGAGNQPGDKVVRLSNLMNHVSQTVPESARKLRQAEQTPFFDTATEDFAVALVRGGKGLPANAQDALPDEAKESGRRVVQAIGERNVAVGGTMSNSPFSTGDGNVIGSGNTISHMMMPSRKKKRKKKR